MSDALSHGEAREILHLWAGKPGRGLALVEFTSEPERTVLAAELAAIELRPLKSETAENSVRQLVDQIAGHSREVVSVAGFESAFPSRHDREQAIAMLNFLREKIAGAELRQIWWMTPETGELFRLRAPDMWSWFSPRLELHTTTAATSDPTQQLHPNASVSLDQARRRILDASSRIETAQRNGIPSDVLWVDLAYPALSLLRQTGAQKEFITERDRFIQLIYGISEDAARLSKIHSDLEKMSAHGAFTAAAELATESEMIIPGASPVACIDRLRTIGGAEIRAGFLERGERRLKIAHDLAVHELGESSTITAATAADLAWAMVQRGDYAGAVSLQQQALSVRQSQFGEEHPETASAINALAAFYEHAGRYVESETLHRRALHIQERTLGIQHPETLASISNLAIACQRQGRFTEAEHLYRRAVEVTQRLLGPDHPDSLAPLTNLASVLVSQGKFAEAEPMYLQSLQANEKALGSDHPSTLTVVNNLAVLYRRLGRRTEAFQLYHRALDARTRVLGPAHPHTLSTVNNLAMLLEEQGQLTEAEQLFRQALTGAESTLGPDHPDTRGYRHNLQRVQTAALLNAVPNPSAEHKTHHR
ncbi:MAG: tetratricopeptide repeat protein [Acidobacteria bacterium]|nr:tetratricopeptide repeat protein [Acidobacteriota bacterium]